MGVYLKGQTSTYAPSPINVADSLYERNIGNPVDFENDPDVQDGKSQVEAGKSDHTHASSQISDATQLAGGDADNGMKLVKTRSDGRLYILTESITHLGHAVNKRYVDELIAALELIVGQKVSLEDTSRGISEATYGTVPRRDLVSNNIRVGGEPLLGYHATPRSYVDGLPRAIPWDGTGSMPDIPPGSMVLDYSTGVLWGP